MVPQIHEYTADINPQGPTDTRQARTADTGNIGSGLADIGSAISKVGGEIHRADAQNEIAQMSADVAQANAQLTIKQTQMTQDADSESVKNLADQIQNERDDTFGAIGEKYSTPEAQAAFKQMDAQSNANFLVSSLHNQSARTGELVGENNDIRMQGLSTQVYNQPSSFGTALLDNEKFFDSVGQNYPNMPGDAVEGMKQQSEKALAAAQFRGYLNIDPQTTVAALKSGQWDKYFDAKDLEQMQQQGKVAVSAQATEQKRVDSLAQAQADARQEYAMQKGLKDLYGNGLSTKDVLNNPDLDFQHQVTLIKMIESNRGDKQKTDPDTMKDLFGRIVAPDGSPGKITNTDDLNQSFIDGKLDGKDLDWLRSQVTGRKTDEGKIESDLTKKFFTYAESQLDPHSNAMAGIKDPDGAERMLSFTKNFYQTYQKQRAAGVPATDLLAPGNPNYMGNLVQAFKPSSEEILNSMANIYSNKSKFIPPNTPTPLAPSRQMQMPYDGSEPLPKGFTPDMSQSRLQYLKKKASQ